MGEMVGGEDYYGYQFHAALSYGFFLQKIAHASGVWTPPRFINVNNTGICFVQTDKALS